MARLTPRSTTRAALATLTGAALLSLSPAAMAAADSGPVSADTTAEKCTVDTQATTRFWQDLAREAVDMRLQELNHEDPGLGDAIAAYDAGAPGTDDQAGDLQLRLVANGNAEGLGMFTLQRNATAPAGDPGLALPTTATYTREEALATAEKMQADPLELARQGLDAQAASGARLYQLQRQLFENHTQEYVAIQDAVRQGLLDCAGELKKPPYGWWAMGGIVALGLVILAVVAWRNSRRPSRHADR